MPDDSKDQVLPSAADSDQSAGDRDILGFGRQESTDAWVTGDGPESGSGSGPAGSEKGTGAAGAGGKTGATGPEGTAGTAESGAQGERPRDAQGRFVAGSAGQAGAAGAGAEKFVFLNEEFDSRDQAEQKWRSYFGSVKGWQDRHDALKKQYDELQARLDKQAAGTPPENAGTGAGAPGADAKAAAKEAKKELGPLAELVDYDLYQEIYEDPTLGPKRAAQYLTMKVDEYLKAAKAEWNQPAPADPRLERVFKDQEEQELFVDTVQTFEKLQARTDSSGKTLYPRLAEEDFAARVTQVYLKDADLRSRGVYGVHLAYLDVENWERYMARDIKNANVGSPAPTPGNGASAPGSREALSPPKPSTAPMDHVLSGSDTPSLVTRGKPQDWVDREFQELEEYARTRGDGGLGF